MQNEIVVYVGKVDEFSLIDSLVLLSSEEKQRAMEKTQHDDAVMYAVCRAQLRKLLARELKCKPQSIALKQDAHGKPALDQGELQFSIAHANERFVIAISKQNVGVDIEHYSRRIAISKIKPLLSHAIDDRLMSGMSAASANELGLKAWVDLEAGAKLNGTALEKWSEMRRSGLDVETHRFTIDEEYFGTIAAKDCDSIRVVELNEIVAEEA